MTFTGKTNRDYVMINTMTFRLESGEEVTLDREYTGFNIDEDGYFEMIWDGCYFWDGENRTYLTDEAETELANADLIRVEIEEDADPAYEVIITSWSDD